jgi:hypothetical protein
MLHLVAVNHYKNLIDILLASKYCLELQYYEKE